MQNRPRGNEYRTTVVCVDSYEKGVPAGRFYNPQLEKGETFQSLTELLRKLDRTLDEMTIPQSFAMVREFGSPATFGGDKAPDDQLQTGKKATFAVRILFRQNASWQGSISWLEARREETFRSVLELIFLMNSALTPPE